MNGEWRKVPHPIDVPHCGEDTRVSIVFVNDKEEYITYGCSECEPEHVKEVWAPKKD